MACNVHCKPSPLQADIRQYGGQEMLLANDPSIMDYFNEEVLNQEPPAIQEFMFQTSILSHLNASICEAVTADGEAHQH